MCKEIEFEILEEAAWEVWQDGVDCFLDFASQVLLKTAQNLKKLTTLELHETLQECYNSWLEVEEPSYEDQKKEEFFDCEK